jgi:hypothetical protein
MGDISTESKANVSEERKQSIGDNERRIPKTNRKRISQEGCQFQQFRLCQVAIPFQVKLKVCIVLVTVQDICSNLAKCTTNWKQVTA